MGKVINAICLELAKFSAKESGKYAIHGIQISPSNIQATDGRVGVIADLETVEDETEVFKPFIVNPTIAKEIAGLIPKKGDRRYLMVKDGEKPMVCVRRDDAYYAVQPEAIQANFPDLDRAFPSGKPIATVAFNPEYIQKLAVLFKKFAKSINIPKFSIYERGMIVIEAQDLQTKQRLRAVLMPIKTADQDEVSYDEMLEASAAEFLKSKGYIVEKTIPAGI